MVKHGKALRRKWKRPGNQSGPRREKEKEGKWQEGTTSWISLASAGEARRKAEWEGKQGEWAPQAGDPCIYTSGVVISGKQDCR